MPPLDLDALRAFAAIADAGGFTAAADRLGLTQSAVSVRIRRLEEGLGKRLFERTSRSTALTRDGELLLAYARRLLDLSDETVRRLTEPVAEGELRLGVGEYVAPQQLPRLLSRLARAYPHVHLEVTVASGAELKAGLEAGALDLVIGMRNAGGTDGRVIRREPLVWAAGPDWQMPADGAPLPLCLMPHPCIYRTRALAGLEAQGRPWRVVYTSPSLLGIQAAAQAGLGVLVLGADALMPGMRVLGPDSGLPDLGDAEIVVLGEDRKSAAIAPLVRFIVEQLQAGPMAA
ncbi:MAG TPA: LysR substrate-binding domain-containing protein [Azospirillaceae bacterium]|nr:LysR substrate-binding domain-containing protein [Azospirillaceae bacterium]